MCAHSTRIFSCGMYLQECRGARDLPMSLKFKLALVTRASIGRIACSAQANAPFL